MSPGLVRRVGFMPWAWALSPLVTVLLLSWGGSDTYDGGLSKEAPDSWSLQSGPASTTLPTPDAARAAVRDELPSGLILYQRVGRLTVQGPGGNRDLPALSVELAAPGGEVQFQALRSPFFGDADLLLAEALSASLANEQGASRLLVGRETAAGVNLRLDGGPPYAAVSLIGGIDLALPSAPVR